MAKTKYELYVWCEYVAKQREKVFYNIEDAKELMNIFINSGWNAEIKVVNK